MPKFDMTPSTNHHNSVNPIPKFDSNDKDYLNNLDRPVTNPLSSDEPESVKVLRECMELQLKKGRDYQNPNSTVVQADYYPSGIKTIHDILHAKMLRAKSVMEAMENDPDYGQNFESLEDTYKDLINYASFAVSYTRGRIPGQTLERDVFNRKRK